MRAPLLVLALLLAGCAARLDPADCARGSDLASTGIERARLRPDDAHIRVDVLHDGRPNRDVLVCAQLQGQRPFGVVMEGRNVVPNVATLAEGYLANASELRVVGFLIGDKTGNRTATFPLTAENHVVLVIQGDNTLRIDKFDEPVHFA